MLKCREVTRIVASDALDEAGWLKRLEVRLHLMMCLYCRRYTQELRAIDRIARQIWGPAAEDTATLARLEHTILAGIHPDAGRSSPGPPDV